MSRALLEILPSSSFLSSVDLQEGFGSLTSGDSSSYLFSSASKLQHVLIRGLILPKDKACLCWRGSVYRFKKKLWTFPPSFTLILSFIVMNSQSLSFSHWMINFSCWLGESPTVKYETAADQHSSVPTRVIVSVIEQLRLKYELISKAETVKNVNQASWHTRWTPVGRNVLLPCDIFACAVHLVYIKG